MKNFNLYAHYYDALYHDKDYSKEAAYVSSLIRKFQTSGHSILELGCGTGMHAVLLADAGYEVSGIDLGEEMIQRANKRRDQLSVIQREKLVFSVGDIRTVRLNRKYSSVVSLFHVMCYQLSNKDLTAAFETAASHLEPGGLFVFDVWYGPAVVAKLPEVRVKRINDGVVNVIRIAEPDIYPNENRVDVKYELIINEQGSAEVSKFSEVHPVRYLFKPEIELFLEIAGFDLLHAEEWLTGNEPSFDTWGVCYIARLK